MYSEPSVPAPPKRQIEGVALILVLGLLAALLIMAFGFASFMRIERWAAGNFVHTVQVRQLTLAALETVIDDINNQYSWSDDTYPVFATPAHRTVQFPSAGEDNFSWIANTAQCASLIYGGATIGGTAMYMPFRELREIGVLTQFGTSVQMLSANWRNSHWLKLTNSAGNLLGLYSYAIIHESGSLDLNVVSNDVSAWVRSGPEHLHLTNLPNIVATNVGAIFTNRNTHLRYYAQPEIKMANFAPLAVASGSVTHANDSRLTTFTMYPQVYHDGFGDTPRVVITNSAAVLQSAAVAPSVLTALVDGGIPATLTNEVFANLIDFVDTDFIPEIVGGTRHLRFCGEPIPLINEIVVDHSITRNSNVVNGTCSLRIEMWYPFSDVSNALSYSLTVRGFLVDGLPATALGPFSVWGPPPQILNQTIAVSPSAGNWTNTPFWTSGPLSFPPFSFVEPVPGAVNISNLRLYLRVELSDSFGNIVDSAGAMPLSGPLDPAVHLLFTNLLSSVPTTDVTVSTNVAMSVNDPRVNWLGEHWGDAPPTFGTTNHSTVYNPGNDGVLFVKNAPIEQTGEIGMIGLGGTNAWASLDLLGPHAGLWDVFTVHGGAYSRGLVNLNASDPEVLGTALYGTRRRRYPTDPSATTNLSWATVTNWAGTIAGITAANNGFSNKSDFVSGILGVGLVPPATANQNERESVLADFMDMVDTRGNTFTVIFRVRAIRDRTSLANSAPNGQWDGEQIDPVLGEQDAVAQIWRDPVTKETRVTFFRWVTTGLGL